MAVRSSANAGAQDWRIYKYPIDLDALDADDSITLMMPFLRRLLYVAVQGAAIVLYALVAVDAGDDGCKLWVKGTGHPQGDMPSTALPLGVCSLHDGRIMLHVFAHPGESR